MEINDTGYLITLAPHQGRMKWQVLNGAGEMLIHSETWDGAVRAAREIGEIHPPVVSIGFREKINFELAGKVLAEKYRLSVGR